MGIIASGLWIMGGLIVAAVLLQMVIVVVGSVQRVMAERNQQALAAKLLRMRIEAARGLRMEQKQHLLTWNGLRKFEVLHRIDEGGDICSFYLVPHDRKPIPSFKPGQYLTFSLDVPGEPKAVIRCYSLSDAPAPDHYRVSIKRIPAPEDNPKLPPGKGSNHFHERIAEGDIVDVKAPSGHFFLDLSAHTPVVLIGGGVGITPVMSMLNALVKARSKREIYFFLGVRDNKEHVMKAHLEQVAREHDNVHLHVCYSRPNKAAVQGRDYHHAERVSVDLFKKVLPSSNFEYYMCGPGPMMKSIVEGLEAWGVPETHVHYEAFGPASVSKKKPAAAEAQTGAASAAATFEITFSRSGKTQKWDPSAASILDFAEACGVRIDSGCRAGNCGTCLTAVKSGEVKYNIETGAKPEDGSCLTCVSVPKGPLVLDA